MMPACRRRCGRTDEQFGRTSDSFCGDRSARRPRCCRHALDSILSLLVLRRPRAFASPPVPCTDCNPCDKVEDVSSDVLGPLAVAVGCEGRSLWGLEGLPRRRLRDRFTDMARYSTETRGSLWCGHIRSMPVPPSFRWNVSLLTSFIICSAAGFNSAL